jgi:hypothetical protein
MIGHSMVWCLDYHARYRCRHAGACCEAGWTIPFEDGTIAARDAHGACSFFDGATRLCSIHGTHGRHALPLTCRMFPRIVLHDARGTFMSLSHFCPTAASLLFEAAGDGAIVTAPAALADVGELDGLDARDAWPPLLRPDVLMDLDSYAAWERRAVTLLTRGDASPADAIAALADVTAAIASWTPGSGELLPVVHGAFDARLTPSGESDRTSRAIKRWLAARLFGSWTAYQRDGLGATVAYLTSCLETFTRELASDGDALEAIRRSDLFILHRAA